MNSAIQPAVVLASLTAIGNVPPPKFIKSYHDRIIQANAVAKTLTEANVKGIRFRSVDDLPCGGTFIPRFSADFINNLSVWETQGRLMGLSHLWKRQLWKVCSCEEAKVEQTGVRPCVVALSGKDSQHLVFSIDAGSLLLHVRRVCQQRGIAAGSNQRICQSLYASQCTFSRRRRQRCRKCR
jgi:hypothetical protein